MASEYTLSEISLLLPGEPILDHPFDLGYWSFVAGLQRPLSESQQSGWDQAEEDDREARERKRKPSNGKPVFTRDLPSTPGTYLLKLPNKDTPGYKDYTVQVSETPEGLTVFHNGTKICLVSKSKEESLWAFPPPPKKPKSVEPAPITEEE